MQQKNLNSKKGEEIEIEDEEPKTPPPQSSSISSHPIVSNSSKKEELNEESLLLCNEEDAFESTKESLSNYTTIIPLNSEKGFDTELQIALEKQVLTQFKFFLKQLLVKVHSNSLNLK